MNNFGVVSKILLKSTNVHSTADRNSAGIKNDAFYDKKTLVISSRKRYSTGKNIVIALRC